jgi:hypothetical protein
MIHKKQLEILMSDKRIKLYDGIRDSHGVNRLMTVAELELLKQSFTPIEFKALYLNEYEVEIADNAPPNIKAVGDVP